MSIIGGMHIIKNSKHQVVFVVLGTLLAAGVVVGTTYQHVKNRQLSTRITSLERQYAAISATLQKSSALSETNKQELQEFSNRSDVIARSQDDLLTNAVERTTPAVVSIVISKDVPLLEVRYENPFGNDPHFRDIGYRIPVFRQVGTTQKQVGAGTGFIVRADGYILTNRHVVNDETADYTVLLSTGEKKNARVVYRDDTHDIAIVKIDGGEYPVVTLGNSSDVKLGQTVVAIGNALGEYNNSVSVGIVSGLDRTIQAQDASGRIAVLSGVIQTDAAINRGNSGGPLLDLSGNVIGVNVAVDRGASNIAFAIPVNVVLPVIRRVAP